MNPTVAEMIDAARRELEAYQRVRGGAHALVPADVDIWIADVRRYIGFLESLDTVSPPAERGPPPQLDQEHTVEMVILNGRARRLSDSIAEAFDEGDVESGRALTTELVEVLTRLAQIYGVGGTQ